MGQDGNPLGAVIIWDGTAPKTITGYAVDTISGGWLVWTSGGSNIVSSGANSYVTADITIDKLASGQDFTGMALHNATSGTPITVATDCVAIAPCAGNVVAGEPVACIGVNNFVPLAVGSAFNKVGRAYTTAGSEQYAIIRITG